MVGALAHFLGKLAGNLNDTRLILAELLIQVQVVHTFDLPRRKDLGYSMLIGLILLGVAATLSQTLIFAPLLMVFLTIALPILYLDYRSRLALPPINFNIKNSPSKIELPWGKFAKLLITIICLGLMIFAAMPRFQGYQLRTFPVSTPINYQGEFDGRGIIRPDGQSKLGNGQGGGSVDDQGEDGTGESDSLSYYGFNTKINQGVGGKELTPQVVLRVRSQAAGFWRVLGFDRYTGKGWEISRNEQTTKIQRSQWAYKFNLNFSFSRAKTKEVVQSYTVVSPLPNIIPTLSTGKELYFPTNEVAQDPEGSLRSPVSLVEGLTYTVVSDVPYRDRTLLNRSGKAYPVKIQQYYLQIPDELATKLRPFTQQLIDSYPQKQVSKNPIPLTSNYEIALYLTQYLKQTYQVPNDPLGIEKPPEDQDLVNWFLFRCQDKTPTCTPGGYRDQFATTLTMMLRSIGIPARLAVGFSQGTFNPFTGYYEVQNTDAHAITEVYFPNYGWFSFDPIPGHPLIPTSIEEDQTFGVLGRFWQWIAGWLPSPVSAFLGKIVEIILSYIMGGMVWFFALFSKGWVGLFTITLIILGFSFFSWLIFQQWQKLRERNRLHRLPPMEKLYQQILTYFSQHGYPKQPSQTPLEYAVMLNGHYPPPQGKIIMEIIHTYVAWKYGNQPVNLEYLTGLWQNLTKSLKDIPLTHKPLIPR
jgi:transglutaminase-like putative cysteine protease